MSDIPEGWALVPLEPTPEMIKACKGALYRHIQALPDAERLKFKERKAGGYRVDQRTKVITRWRAMVGAAPCKS